MARRPVVNPPQPRLNFHVDSKRELLWIIHRKVAGSSLRKALGIRAMVPHDVALPYNNWRTIMVVRHPWDRITSAICNVFGPIGESFAKRITEEILSREGPHAIDWHLWPQSYAANGFRVDDLILFEHLPERWASLRNEYDLPVLEHINRGKGHDWRHPNGEEFDWAPLLPLYERDFEYCEGWDKV